MNIFKRTLAIVLSAFFICASVPAQLELGPYRLSSPPAPTLRTRTSIRTGLGSIGRPRISFVGKIGGVAFDGTAAPETGLTVTNLALRYLPSQSDGQRLSVVINDQTVSAPIYDWQLIPIAKFADSEFYSCFTLFGDLNNAEEQSRVLNNGGRVLNYHPTFVDTLVGLRLFQLDNLIINPYSWDLVKSRGVYILGAGESAPDKEQNLKGMLAFLAQNPELKGQGSYQSYVISDNRRRIVFYVQGSELKLAEEPSYYFWKMHRTSKEELKANAQMIHNELVAQVKAVLQNPSVDGQAWLRDQLLEEAEKYDELVGSYWIIEALRYPQLLGLLTARGRTARAQILSRTSPESMFTQLELLRIVGTIQNAEEVSALSQKISRQTTGLRAINPAVWDAGVAVMQWAAFFRYCKENHPRQWELFMRQVRTAPSPKPGVITPTVMHTQ